jgi:hypothetical protein
MEKIKSLLLNANVALLAFVAFTVRLVVTGVNFSEALALLVYAGLYGYTKWLKAREEITKDKHFTDKVEKELQDLRSAVGAMKLGQATWGMNTRKVGGNVGQQS